MREAMKSKPVIGDNFDNSLRLASIHTSISQSEWISHGDIVKLMRQKTLSE
ncbi:MAG: hypothetical protein P8X78_05650, partial [Nitrosopumilaceae archaeon]